MADYIDREVAIKAVCDSSAHTCDLKKCSYGCQEAQAILAVPAADVAPVRHGRWIEREDMYYGWNIWECSACREEFCVEEGTPKDNEYNYCPNCGARMDGDA